MMRKPSLRQLWALLGIPTDYALARRLPVQRGAKKLVAIGRNRDGPVIKLGPRAATAWSPMQAAAGQDGIARRPTSGFRSIARQTKIIREKLTAGQRIRENL